MIAAFIFAACIFASFATCERLAPGTGARASLMAVPEERIITSFIGRFIRIEALPAGIYFWQKSVTRDRILSHNASLGIGHDDTDLDEAFRSFRFPEDGQPWVKFLVKNDGSINMSSRGLISETAGSAEDLEFTSNMILSRIRENRGIRMSDESAGDSVANVYRALYNAIRASASLGPVRKLEGPAGPATAADISISGKRSGVYYETSPRDFFSRSAIALCLKSGAGIAGIFIVPSKRSFMRTAGITESDFIDRFHGLSVADSGPESTQLIPQAERRNAMFRGRADFIRRLQPILAAARDELERKDAPGAGTAEVGL